MPRKYTVRSKEEKLSIVKRNLTGESACSLAKEIGSSDFQVRSWGKIYLAEGEAGLELKKKPGNPRDNAVMESFWGDSRIHYANTSATVRATICAPLLNKLFITSTTTPRSQTERETTSPV